MIGQTISHYTILEKLGEGGMGIVFKATDTRLDRIVALKFLPRQSGSTPEERQRFVNEARAASALDHPHICNIHDVDETDDGQMFIVMGFYDGETLDQRVAEGPLPVKDVVDFAIQAAEGLEVAHAKGIVHRDIKSSNLIVTPEGQLKIMDFGLAKSSAVSMVTQAGVAVGTVPFMSPEQARGEKVDQRTDIWSLGVVMYHMLAGRLPFLGEYSEALVYLILNEDPPPISSLRGDIPEELGQIVKKCLAKDQKIRYQDTDEILADLYRLRGIPAGIGLSWSLVRKKTLTPRILATLGASIILTLSLIMAPQFFLDGDDIINSIAVLPFENLSDNKEDEYFSDGITEDVIARLSKIGQLKVISRTSVMQYKGIAKPLREIAEELGVATILEGSVRRAGDRIRIVAQLIDVVSEEHIWADTYDKELKDVFAIQSDVAEQIAVILEIQLSTRETDGIEDRPTENVIAYSYFLRGNSYVSGSYEKSNTLSAIQMYEKAISEDSTFALAYAKLSQAHQNLYWFYIDRTGERLSMAKEAAEKALQLDADLADGYVAMGEYFYHGLLDFDKALEFLRAAEEREPNNASALTLFGYVYRRSGEWQRALPYQTKALELDPRSAKICWNVGVTHLQQREFNIANRYFDQAIALSPGMLQAYYLKAWSFLNEEGFTKATRAHLLMYLTLGEGEQLTTIIADGQPWWLLRVVDKELQDVVMHMSLKYFGIDTLSYYLTKGFVSRIQHRNDLARAYFDSVRVLSSNKIATDPNVARFHSLLGVALAGLGEKEKALLEAENAAGMLPISKDALWGRVMTENLALVYAMTGEHERAIEMLEYLMSVPGMISPRFLEADPIWNHLGSYPRFQKLLAGID